MNLPTGTVTFLFTDIEGSTKLWELHPETMRCALARHDELLRAAIELNRGYVFKTFGDAFCAAFSMASEAIQAAIAAQSALLSEPWPVETKIKVRMALHAGAVESRDNDYFGPPVNRVARLLSTVNGCQVILSRVAHDLCSDSLPPDCSLKPLGEHRLKDLGRSEIVFQLFHPGLPSEFPPLRSIESRGVIHNLPQQLTSFIGRDKEMAEIKELLQRSRLVTLTGSGGTGKTRLAVQAAADVTEQYPDGVWLVELAALSDPGLVPQAVAQALDIRELPGELIARTLLSALKEKKTLVLLDNCEHVLDSSARLVDAVLKSCSNVSTLITSREALGISGEASYRVPSLSLPDTGEQHTPDSLLQFEAARLFIARAREARTDFAVTEYNASALASACRRLDGIPFAIELAAARVRSLSVEEINSRLDHRFRLLTGGSRTALPRQQTLRAMIDWSYDLLDEHEKALLHRLSVFAGGWRLEAAEAVCAADKAVGNRQSAVEGTSDHRLPIADCLLPTDVLELLTSLCGKSLVMADQQVGVTRYRLLETVRQYARERLVEIGESEMVWQRHLDHFLSLAEVAEPELSGPEQVDWLKRLDEEHDNLRASLSWSLELAGSTKCLRICGALWAFWAMRGYFSEGRAWCERALQADGCQGRTHERARALSGVGSLALYLGDLESSRAYLEESLIIYREIGDKRGIGASFNGLGRIAMAHGNYPVALSYFERCLSIEREIVSKSGIASALNNLGIATFSQGDYAASRTFHNESLAIQKQIGNLQGIAVSLSNLGSISNAEGDYISARAYYGDSLTVFRETGNKSGIANTLMGLGISATNNGDYGAARAYLEEGLYIRKVIGSSLGITSSLNAFAYLAVKESQSELAAMFWGAAAAFREAIGSPLARNEQEKYDREVAVARQSLGDETFQKAWDRGRGMTMDEAIALALSEDPTI